MALISLIQATAMLMDTSYDDIIMMFHTSYHRLLLTFRLQSFRFTRLRSLFYYLLWYLLSWQHSYQRGSPSSLLPRYPSLALQNENVSTLDLCKNSQFYKLNVSFSTHLMSKWYSSQSKTTCNPVTSRQKFFVDATNLVISRSVLKSIFLIL